MHSLSGNIKKGHEFKLSKSSRQGAQLPRLIKSLHMEDFVLSWHCAQSLLHNYQARIWLIDLFYILLPSNLGKTHNSPDLEKMQWQLGSTACWFPQISPVRNSAWPLYPSYYETPVQPFSSLQTVTKACNYCSFSSSPTVTCLAGIHSA